MVVFTCGHCGESVQKPKVEKHYLTKCRNRNPNLSCMDCFKDFMGNDFEAHTKCITEEQRYSGKGFVAKEKKGEKKQTAWVEMLQSVLDEQKNAPKNVLRIVETISKHNNTPRKKPKFVNFVKNVCGAKTNPKDIDQAWDLISVKLSELSKSNTEINNQDKKEKVPETNGHETEHNNDDDNEDDRKIENNEKESDQEIENKSDTKENGTDSINDTKKLSKKQRKEEKKRKKYEAELQKAAEPPTEIEEKENYPTKKDKKKKNKEEVTSNGDNEAGEDNNKIKKRKRQDTINGGIVEASETVTEPIVTESVGKEKTQKKKPKVVENNHLDLSVCLHDQNVATASESEPKKGKFDWHAVIMSVLQKKGNELPFKRLQKKVLGEYSEATGCEIDDRIAEKFIKKIKSCPKVKVDKNRVVLEE